MSSRISFEGQTAVITGAGSGIGRALALSLAAGWPTPAQAIEEPRFTLERQLADEVEIRLYAPYVVAEVVLDAAAEDAGSQAFPILAGYIFGKNKGERTMAMTAPVTQMPAQAAEPVKLAMTAPVTQTPSDGGYRVQFVLPSDVSLDTAPRSRCVQTTRTWTRLVPVLVPAAAACA